LVGWLIGWLQIEFIRVTLIWQWFCCSSFSTNGRADGFDEFNDAM